MRYHYYVYGIAAVIVLLSGFIWLRKDRTKQSIKVGILHSLTGTLKKSETNVVEATMMAIDEINAQGGVLGRHIEPIIIDGKSDEMEFEKGALELINTHGVKVIFGVWLSAAKRRLRPIMEKEQCILFYPTYDEGIEESPNIIYTGAAPNQAIIPAVTWSFYNLGKKFFIIAPDQIFGHVANAIIKFQAALLGAEVVGEMYIPIRSTDTMAIVEAIKKTQPTVIFNAVGGAANETLFPQLRAAGISSDKIPTVSLSIAEPELVEFKEEIMMSMVGDYSVYNYFQSIDREENRKFVSNFKKRYGQDRVLSNNMESAYDNVYLWAKTVEATQSTDISRILSKLKDQVFDGPGSIIYIDRNNHAWREVFVGKIRYDKQFDIVWSSKNTLYPEPYPPYQTKKQWESFLMQLYKSWGNKWSA